MKPSIFLTISAAIALITGCSASYAEQSFTTTGTLDLIGRGDASFTPSDFGGTRHFLDENGAQTGSDLGKQWFRPASINDNLDILIHGQLSAKTSVVIRTDIGNYLETVGNTSALGYGENNGSYSGRDGQPGEQEGSNTASIAFTNAFFMAHFANDDKDVFQAGRIGLQLTPYTFRQPDADIYTSVFVTSSGNETIDGAKVNYQLGKLGILAYAGETDSQHFSQPYTGSQNQSINTLLCGCSLNTIQSRGFGQILQNEAAAINHAYGIRTTYDYLRHGELGATFEQFDLSSSPVDPMSGRAYTVVSVFGADAQGELPLKTNRHAGTLGYALNYTVSMDGGLRGAAGSGYQYSQHSEMLSGKVGQVHLKGGYSYIGPYFSAPGAWGKVGAWTNPTNVEGEVLDVSGKVGPSLHLDAEYDSYHAVYGGAASPLQHNDNVHRVNVDTDYTLNSRTSISAGYQYVLYDLRNERGALFSPGKPVESYATFGFKRTLSAKTSLNLIYQIADYNDEGTGFDPVNGSGDVAVAQYELKF